MKYIIIALFIVGVVGCGAPETIEEELQKAKDELTIEDAIIVS